MNQPASSMIRYMALKQAEEIRAAETAQLGAMHCRSFAQDPKHLAFTLARYHFVARMLIGMEKVLEVGCGDGTGGRIVAAAVGGLLGVDRDSAPITSFPTARFDFLEGPWDGEFDAAYALDVLEHVPADKEFVFLENMADSIKPTGTVIIGMPSLESQDYASENSKAGHVNCKTENGLRLTLKEHFRNVFLFGMNDTTLHVGFGPMCQYRLAICTEAI